MQLNRDHNQQLLVCSAPPEILCEIFLALRIADIYASQHCPSHNSKIPFYLLAVIRVCHAWRQAAFGFPALFTAVSDCYPHKVVEWMLAHSASLPLVFYSSISEVDGRDDPRPGATPVLRDLARVEKLYLRKGLPYCWKSMHDIMKAIMAFENLPLLQVLDLRDIELELIDTSDLSTVSMPNLRSLGFKLWEDDWTCIILPQAPILTSLSLRGCCDMAYLGDTLRFVEENFPLLTTLTLEDDGGLDGEVQPGPPVSFRGLELLRLVGEAKNLPIIAASISISQSCELLVQITMEDSSWDTTTALHLHNLIHARTDGPGPAAEAAYFEFTKNRFIVMLGHNLPSLQSAPCWSTDMIDVDVDIARRPPMPARVVLEWTGIGHLGHSDWFEQCQQLLSLDRLRSVAIQADKGLYQVSSEEHLPDAQIVFLRHMSRVETLRTNDSTLEAFALLKKLGSSEIVLPSLRHFIIDDICVSETSLSWAAHLQLKACICLRKELGVPLREVSLSACRDHEGCQELVAGIVEEQDAPEYVAGTLIVLRKTPVENLPVL